MDRFVTIRDATLTGPHRPRDDPFARCLQRLEHLPQGTAYLTSLAQRYSYVLPEPRLLNVLRSLAPLVEIGAGTGYWAYRLRQLRTDIIAFDQSPPDGARLNRYHGESPTWTEILEADHTVLAGHRRRTLFVCWPPLFSALGDCLTYYSGDTVACIGDTGFRTARLQGLTEDFEEVAVYPARALEPFPGVEARLSIWRRRHRAWGSGMISDQAGPSRGGVAMRG